MSMEKRWQKVQANLGYTDEQMVAFRSNPKYVKMIENTPQFFTHKIVAEVIKSHGCSSRLKVGDKIVMNGAGQLITAECPENICIWALAPLGGIVNAIYERFVAHLDPNGLLFDVINCQDVGIECGGWGQIQMKIRIEGPQGD